jgi:D-aminopeptidase
LLQAAVEAAEEAILNAMCMASEVHGVSDRVCPALPIERIAQLTKVFQGRM